MAEIRNRSWGEKVESAVQTARATPRTELHDPITAAYSEAAASVPLPSDIKAFAKMVVEALTNYGQDPERPNPVSAVGSGDTYRSLLDYADNHPLQLLAALGGPPGAVAAYRELTPWHVRNWMHQFYGGGREMTYAPRRVRKALSSPEETYYADPLPARTAVRSAEAHGVTPPEWVDPAKYVSGRAFHMSPDVPVGVEKEVSAGLGKFFLNPEKEAWDWYRFFPEVYKYGPSHLENWKELLKSVKRGLLEGGGEDPFGMPGEYFSQPLGQRVKNVADKLEYNVPRLMAVQAGTPYPIRIPLESMFGSPTTEGILNGLEALPAYGAATLPVAARKK